MNLCTMKILDDFVLRMLDGYFFKVNHGRFLQYWKEQLPKLYIPKMQWLPNDLDSKINLHFRNWNLT